MNSQLFIPKKCKAGFNLRADTYSGKLAYVIAFDGKKWRKEPSWENWRQKVGAEKGYNSKEVYGDEVAPIEFDNVPTSGFVLNKKVGGYKSHWNVRQTMARIFDPRGFEFEITVPNLLYILETCNCMKGKGLEGEFVYSWDGKDLVLLPCSAWEYEKANTFTGLQSQKISAKTLIPGASYKTKREEDLVYVGRFFWYEINLYGSNAKKTREGKKSHIFTADNGKSFIIKSSVDFLAVQNTESPVSNYAEIIEKFQSNTHSSKIVKWEVTPCEFDTTSIKRNGYQDTLKKAYYYVLKDNLLFEYNISPRMDYNYSTRDYTFKGYTYYAPNVIDINTHSVKESGGEYRSSYGLHVYSEDSIKNLNLGDLTVTLENGKKIKVRQSDDWSSSLLYI